MTEARAIAYPSDAHFREAASAASEACELVTKTSADVLLTSMRLRFVGCGFVDEDCFQLVNLLRRTGALQELRSIEMSQVRARVRVSNA